MLISKIISARFFASVDAWQTNLIHVMLGSRKFWNGRSWKSLQARSPDVLPPTAHPCK